MGYSQIYDQPWEMHPDTQTPINDLEGVIYEDFGNKPF